MDFNGKIKPEKFGYETDAEKNIKPAIAQV